MTEKLVTDGKPFHLTQIAVAVAKEGDTAGALAMAEKLEDYLKADSLAGIAEAMAKAGDKAGAKAVLSQALASAEKLEVQDNAKVLSVIS